MPAVLVPFVAVGVALLVLLAAYALTVLFTPIIEGILREVPLVGGFLAGKVDNAAGWAKAKIVSYADTGVDLLTGWFHGLATATREFAAAVDAYLVELPDKLDHLVNVTVPRIVHDLTRDIRNTADAANTDATAALIKLDDLATQPLSDFHGIEHGVRNLVDRLHELVKNVDIPNVLTDAETAAGGLFDLAEQKVTDLHDAVYSDIDALYDQLNALPLQQLLDAAAASTALGVFVHTIANEAGLSDRECRSKFKQICATDPGAWSALLDIAGIAALWVGFDEMILLMQDFARELVPAIEELVHGG